MHQIEAAITIILDSQAIMVAGKTGRDHWNCDVENYPPEWLGSIEYTHRAIDDARGYANLLSFLIDKSNNG